MRTLEKTDGFDKPTGFCGVRQLDVRRACKAPQKDFAKTVSLFDFRQNFFGETFLPVRVRRTVVIKAKAQTHDDAEI